MPTTSTLTRRPAPPQNRPGFTLLELLVVIAIIGILATALTFIVRGTLTAARNAATITTLQKLHNNLKERSNALSNHIQSLDSQIDKYYFDTDDNKRTNWFTHAGQNKELARVLLVKDYTRRTFPMTWGEIPRLINLDPSSATSESAPDQLRYGDYSFLSDNNEAESAELLYYAITGEQVQDVKGKTIPTTWTPLPLIINIPGYAPAGRDAFTSGEIGDTDGDGLLEVLDGWGKPFRFYRWPTRLLRPGGVTVNDAGRVIPTALDSRYITFLNKALPSGDDLNRDPDDPLGLTTEPRWKGNRTFETAAPTLGFHTLGTYHAMLIVSPGEDGILGLREPTNTAGFGNLGMVLDPTVDPNLAPTPINDDISNLNATAGRN